MKERPDGVAPHKPSGTRKFCADVDVLRTEEWKKRRLLRIEQVRQQSKDIASDIRRKVRLEKNSLTEDFQKRNQAATTRWKEHKLTALQNELTQTLSYVGSAHKQAECESRQEEAKQELKNHHIEDADRRGREAILQLRSDALARKQAGEARKLQQQHVRFVEGARTAVVVSLPVPKSTVPIGNVPHIQKTEVVQRERSGESSSKQWSSKAWSASIPLGVTPANIDDIDSNRTNTSLKSHVTVESKDDIPAHSLPSQQSDTTSVTVSERPEVHVAAPANASSSKSTVFEARKINVTAPKTDKEPKEVELYDYTNGSHVQYIKPSVVCKSIPAGHVDGLEAAEAYASNSDMSKNASETFSAKRIERGKVAMKRVQARREHQALLSELAGLVRQQASLGSFLPSVPEEPKKIQAKLNEAVINILKESPRSNLLRRNSESEKTEPVPNETGSVRARTCSETDDTIVDVCSHDEAILPLEDSEGGHFKGHRILGVNTLGTTGKRGNIAEQVQRMGANIPGTKSSERETFDDSFSTNETSIGSDVPKLNLALWTSRSPGNSDVGDKTLTPSEKQKERTDSSSNTDLGDKMMTPPGEQNKNKSSRRSSPSASNVSTTEPVTEVQIKSLPADRISPTDKYSSQNNQCTTKSHTNRRGSTTAKSDMRNTLYEGHLGSGDYISQTHERRSSFPKQKSPELLPKANDTGFERGTPTQTTSVSEERRRRSKKVSPASSGSTSYMSLPNKLLSALTDDLRSLLSLTRRRQGADGPSYKNPLLARYINRLLDMSRESVERLNVITSEVPTPPSAVFRNSSYDSSSRRSISLPVPSDPNESERRSDFISSSTGSTKPSDLSSPSDSSVLVDVMQQCYARISSLAQMIEQGRQGNVVPTPVQRRKSSSPHLDSTAYLSPPASVMPLSEMLPRNIEQPGRNNPMDDTYGAVITRLVSEIRQQLAKEAEKPIQIHLTPPHGSAKYIESPSPNELSTIPEHDSNSLDWSSVIISSATDGSSEDVEKEFSRMGLGWAGTTLRKTKEACTLDSNSSSDFSKLSTLSLFGSYSHSTPIKTVDEKQSYT